ncbi:hypothetical protein AB3X91_14750 [Paraburkholderia sp. BR14263]|uniref:hypothetical protein n=1 Tax=unclassified Paraburkholderia TaxID=2615204 RepID=UPI0034CD432A
MKKLISLATVLALAGCASGPKPMGRDTYIMTDTGAWSWSSGSELKAGLFGDATKFCASQGKEMMPVNTDQTDASFSRFAHAEIQFRCLAADDPALGRPTMKSRPNIVIESK